RSPLGGVSYFSAQGGLHRNLLQTLPIRTGPCPIIGNGGPCGDPLTALHVLGGTLSKAPRRERSWTGSPLLDRMPQRALVASMPCRLGTRSAPAARSYRPRRTALW